MVRSHILELSNELMGKKSSGYIVDEKWRNEIVKNGF